MSKSASGLYLAKSYFLVAAAADARFDLVAFDRALLSVGLGNINLIRLSSILPPGLPKERPPEFQIGSFVGAAYATTTSAVKGALIGAGVAIAHPVQEGRESVIMEKAGIFSAKTAEDMAIEMALQALKSRQLHLKSIESLSVDHIVEDVGCVFSAVVQV